MSGTEICLYCMCDRGAGAVCAHCGKAKTDIQWDYPLLRPGTLLHGNYLVGRALGRGGFAITYLGLQMNLGRRVAIKEYLPRDLAERQDTSNAVGLRRDLTAQTEARTCYQRGLQRFIEEGRNIVRCHHPTPHPNIVRVTDHFEENGTAYLVMDFVDGVSLQGYLEQQPGGRMDEARAVRALMPVLDALRAVHERGFHHRDVKPANIYLSHDGPVILLDFGSARLQLREETNTMTIMLTPGYAAPEQYSSKGAQGPWTDVYGCAATLYRCVAGSEPISATDRMADVDLVRPSEIPGCRISPEREAVILWGLDPSHKKRPQTISAFQQALGNPKTWRPPTQPAAATRLAPRRDRKRPRKGKQRVVLGLALAALTLVAVAVTGYIATSRNGGTVGRRPARADRERLEDAVKGLEETRGPLTPEDLARYAPVEYAEARRLEDAAERLQATNAQQAATRLDEARQVYEQAAETAGRRREEHARLESELNRARARARQHGDEALNRQEYLEAFAQDAWSEAYARWEAAEAALGAWREEEDALDPSAWAALWDHGARVEGITKLYREAATNLENVFSVAHRERQEHIARRLAAARQELKANALDQAYATFDEVLQMEDNHAEALQGIRDVHRLRLAAIQTAIDASDFDRADQLITATRTMRNANTGDLNHLQQRLGDARQADAAQRERERLAREMEDARIQVTEARNAAHAEGAADPTCPFWAQGESRRNKAEQHAAEDRGIALARDEFRAAIPFYEAAKAGAQAFAIRERALNVVEPNEPALRDLMTHAAAEFQAGDDSSANPGEAKAHYDAAAAAYQKAIEEHERILKAHGRLQEDVQEAERSAREWVNKVPSDDGSAAREKMREAIAHRVAGRLAEARDAYNEVKGLCITWVLQQRRQTAADLQDKAASAPADITLEEARRDFREAETAITRDPEGAIRLYDRAIEKFNLVLDALPQAQEETHGLLSPLQPQAPQPQEQEGTYDLESPPQSQSPQPQEREDTYDLESPPAGFTQPAPAYRRLGAPIQPNLYRGDN